MYESRRMAGVVGVDHTRHSTRTGICSQISFPAGHTC